jgi:hypothetical protein
LCNQLLILHTLFLQPLTCLHIHLVSSKLCLQAYHYWHSLHHYESLENERVQDNQKNSYLQPFFMWPVSTRFLTNKIILVFVTSKSWSEGTGTIKYMRYEEKCNDSGRLKLWTRIMGKEWSFTYQH